MAVTNEEIKLKIETEEDFIKNPKYQNSLAKYIDKNDEGAEDPAIAKMLMITEDEVRKAYDEAVEMLREDMVDED